MIFVKVLSANNSIKYSNGSATSELELKKVERNAPTPLSSCPLGARPINSWLNRQTNDCLKTASWLLKKVLPRELVFCFLGDTRKLGHCFESVQLSSPADSNHSMSQVINILNKRITHPSTMWDLCTID